MASLNRVVLIGNLTKDPELRYTSSGQPVTTLRLAVNERRKQDDEWKEVAHFFDVVVWGRQAENSTTYLSKGRAVAIDGRLQSRTWETAEGQKRSAVEVVADRVVFLGGGEGGAVAGTADEGGGGDAEPPQGGDAEPSQGGDDIPF